MSMIWQRLPSYLMFLGDVWSMNVVAGSPLDVCHVLFSREVVGKQSHSCFSIPNILRINCSRRIWRLVAIRGRCQRVELLVRYDLSSLRLGQHVGALCRSPDPRAQITRSRLPPPPHTHTHTHTA